MVYRFYISNLKPRGNKITITDKKIIHQITKVLRLKKNDIFTLFSSWGEYKVILKDLSQQQIITAVLEQEKMCREPDKKIHLYQSLLKKDKFEWILQKGTELGISEFTPIICHNSVVREISANKLKRYQAIIKEATEQCGGQQLAILNKAVDFKNIIDGKKISNNGKKIIAWEGEKSQKFKNLLDPKEKEFHILIGPEGGFSAKEVEVAKKAGFATASLGKRILRSETAALAACSFIFLS